MTECTIKVNTGATDQIVGVGTFTTMDIVNDYLIFSAGSAVVADGEAIPSEAQLNSAASVISESAPVEVAKCFLADVGSNLLREIDLYADNARYVFAFDFDGATASEPILEMWDDVDLDSYDLYSLGDGTPNDSWFAGVCTTDALPGASWTGTPLAGSGASNIIYLNNNNGAIAVATVLYANLKVTIPANPSRSAKELPVLVVKYFTN